MKRIIFVFVLIGMLTGGQAQDQEEIASYTTEGETVAKNWRIGGGIGVPLVHGDIKSQLGYSADFTAIYNFHKLFAARGALTGGVARGRNDYMNSGITRNNVWNGTHNEGSNYVSGDIPAVVVYNFKSTFVNLGLSAELKVDVLAERWMTLNPDRKWHVNMTLGGGAYFYNTKVNAMNERGERYNFKQMSNNEVVIPDQENKQEQLKSTLDQKMDNSYETPAESNNQLFSLCDPLAQHKGNTIHNRCQVSAVPSLSAGFYAEYQVAKKWAVGLRFQQNKTFNDYIDGHRINDRYQKTHDDWYSFSHFSVIYTLHQ